MDRFGPTGKVSKKEVHLSRWTTFLGWTGAIEMDCSIWPFRPILNPRTSLFATKWRKILSSALLWTVNSRSIGVTRTSMYRYHRSVASSQAKCMFWLLTALKDSLFPERIWNVLFVIRFERGVWSHMANIWERSAQNNPFYWLNYHEWSSSHNITDITVEIVI